MSAFCGSTFERIKHFVAPTLVEDEPGVIIIHVGCNDVTKQKWTLLILINLQMILLILQNYVLVLVLRILLSSVLPKRNISLTRIIRELTTVEKKVSTK